MPDKELRTGTTAGKEDVTVSLSLKAVTLIKLVDSGIICRDEAGGVDTKKFEAFWESYESALSKEISNRMYEERQACRMKVKETKEAMKRELDFFNPFSFSAFIPLYIVLFAALVTCGVCGALLRFLK